MCFIVEAEPVSGQKRKYSLIVKNVPKNHDQKKFAKFLAEHDVSFSKIKKVNVVFFLNFVHMSLGLGTLTPSIATFPSFFLL